VVKTLFCSLITMQQLQRSFKMRYEITAIQLEGTAVEANFSRHNKRQKQVSSYKTSRLLIQLWQREKKPPATDRNVPSSLVSISTLLTQFLYDAVKDTCC